MSRAARFVLLGLLVSPVFLGTACGRTPVRPNMIAAQPPNIAQILSAAAAVVTALGVVVGGGLAYRRLVSGRTFRPRLKIELTAEAVDVEKTRGLRISVSLSNIGQTTIRFAKEYSQRLRVVGIRAPIWEYAAGEGAGIVEWTEGFYVDLDALADQGVRQLVADMYPAPLGEELKPSDELRREFLVPQFEGGCAYLVLLTMQACTHAGPWQARRHLRCTTGKRDRYLFHARTLVTVTSRARTASGTVRRRGSEEGSDEHARVSPSG